MTKITASLFLAALLALCLHVASAHAQLVRTCVSMAKGNDANAASSCHCTTPCRTFAVAHNNTLPDGEITVIDPGDYGGLTITKSISINNDSGGEASVSVSGGLTGIIVNAPAAGYVNLRGLTIQGVGFGGGRGILFNTGFALTIENCVIRNHSFDAIFFAATTSSKLAVSNTLLADNGGDGVHINPSVNGSIKVVLDRVRAVNNSSDGIDVIGGNSVGTIAVSVIDSVLSNNGAAGIRLFGAANQSATSLLAMRSLIANNGTGVIVSIATNATVRLAQSALTGNTATSLVQGISNLQSYGDNYIDGNGDSNPGPLVIPKK